MKKIFKCSVAVVGVLALAATAFASFKAPASLQGAVIADKPPVFVNCPSAPIVNYEPHIYYEIIVRDTDIYDVNIETDPLIPHSIEGDSYVDDLWTGNINFYMPPAGIYAVEITATDIMGNIAICPFDIINNYVSNHSPVAVDDLYSVSVGDPLTVLDVLTNDSDPDSDPLTLDTVISVTPTSGIATIVDNKIEYIVPASPTTDIFRYFISDGNGGTAYADFVVTVLDTVNNPPVANNDSAETEEDNAININATANDTDEDGDMLFVESFEQGSNGSVVRNDDDGTLIYTPYENFNGSDSFEYVVIDNNGGSDTATVTIIVTPVNDAPVANDSSAETDENTAVIINVLDNDFDVDGDDLIVIAVSTVVNGNALINPGNLTITYTPNLDFFGTDTFTYTISDGSEGGLDTATVNVLVNETGIGCYEIEGNVNINPGNNDNSGVDNSHEFFLETPDGVITRDDLHAASDLPSNGVYYEGSAALTKFKPKSNYKYNVININGEEVTLRNHTIYTLEGEINVVVYNDRVKKGKAMGQWWLTLESDCGTCDFYKNGKNKNECTAGWDWGQWRWVSCN